MESSLLTKKKQLKVRLTKTYGIFNKELVDEKFVRLHGKPEIKEIFSLTKINNWNRTFKQYLCCL